MSNSLIDKVHSKSRDEWKKEAEGHCSKLRGWIKENPELSTAIGVAAGILLVLFPAIVILLLIIAGVVAVVIYKEAPSDPASYDKGEHKDGGCAGGSCSSNSDENKN